VTARYCSFEKERWKKLWEKKRGEKNGVPYGKKVMHTPQERGVTGVHVEKPKLREGKLAANNRSTGSRGTEDREVLEGKEDVSRGGPAEGNDSAENWRQRGNTV